MRILDAAGRLVRTIVTPLDPATIPCSRHGAVWCRACRLTGVMGRHPLGPAEYEPLLNGVDAYGDRKPGHHPHRDTSDTEGEGET